MLKKKYRLPSSVRLEKAKTKSFKYFVLKTADNSFSYPRFAFVISKKVDGRAVIRNKIKREMTNYIAKNIEKIVPGKDMIFILKRSAAQDAGLALSIEDSFTEEGLLK